MRWSLPVYGPGRRSVPGYEAAGVGAAAAVQDGCRPRDVDVAKVQKVLRQQEAYLG